MKNDYNISNSAGTAGKVRGRGKAEEDSDED